MRYQWYSDCFLDISISQNISRQLNFIIIHFIILIDVYTYILVGGYVSSLNSFINIQEIPSCVGHFRRVDFSHDCGQRFRNIINEKCVSISHLQCLWVLTMENIYLH